MASLQVLREEKLAENAQLMGEVLRAKLREFQQRYPFITTVRGKGLLNAIVIDEKHENSAWDLCMEMANRGLLAKPTHDHIIRLAPPLVITEAQLKDCISIMDASFETFSKKKL